MLCGCLLLRGHNGDECELALIFCCGDLFVLSRARVQRVRLGSVSSELTMCGMGVRSILLLLLVARCNRFMYMSHVFF